MTDLPNCDIVSVGKWHSLVFVFKSKICNLQSEMEIAPKERRIERVFFLGYFEKKSLGTRLVESKTS